MDSSAREAVGEVGALSPTEHLCGYIPFGSRPCTKPGHDGLDGRCFEHANRFCDVCGQLATHDCTGAVGSSFCAAPICDECNDREAGIHHVCGSLPPRTETTAEREVRRSEERKQQEAAEVVAREWLRQEREAARIAKENEPDPRDEPTFWTPHTISQEHRPKRRDDGSGGRRSVWAVCEACGTEKTLDIDALYDSGHRDQPFADMKLRCECGKLGHAVMRWVNPPRPQSATERATGKWRLHKPRPGSYDFGTGKKAGGWD